MLKNARRSAYLAGGFWRRSLPINLALTLCASVAFVLNCAASFAGTRLPQNVIVGTSTQTAYCMPSDTLHFAGNLPLPSDAVGFELSINGHTVNKSDDVSTGDYDLTWVPNVAGDYRATIKVIRLYGNNYCPQIINIHSMNSQPVVFGSLPTSTVQVVPVTANTFKDPEFTPEVVTYTLDGNKVGSSQTSPYLVSLDLSAATTGPHSLSLRATNKLGDTYLGETAMINVPVRISMQIPATIHISNVGDKTHFAVTLADGFAPQSVVFYLNNTTLVKIEKPPFTTDIDLSAYPTGRYQFNCLASSANGQSFPSAMMEGDIINDPSDAKIAAEALAQQKAVAQQAAADAEAHQKALALAAANAALAAQAQKQAAADAAQAASEQRANQVAELRRELFAPPVIPVGALPKKCGAAISLTLATTPPLVYADYQNHLAEIIDITKGDSLVYPLSVKAINKYVDWASLKLMTVNALYSVNSDTGQVSPVIGKW